MHLAVTFVVISTIGDVYCFLHLCLMYVLLMSGGIWLIWRRGQCSAQSGRQCRKNFRVERGTLSKGRDFRLAQSGKQPWCLCLGHIFHLSEYHPLRPSVWFDPQGSLISSIENSKMDGSTSLPPAKWFPPELLRAGLFPELLRNQLIHI